MDTAKLNDYSRELYELLLKRYPQWTKEINEAEIDDSGNFGFKVKSPIKEEDIYLGVYTDSNPPHEDKPPSGEITWEYDYGHSHSGGTTVPESFKWVTKEIDSLVSGRKTLAAVIENGKPRNSIFIDTSSIKTNLQMTDVVPPGTYDKPKSFEPLNKISKMLKQMVEESPPFNRIVSWDRIYKKETR